MAEKRVLVIGGGLAGLAATMRLAESGIHVDLVSLVPVKRSHSVCAQGGINSVNALTRQQGDNEPHQHGPQHLPLAPRFYRGFRLFFPVFSHSSPLHIGYSIGTSE